MWQCKMNIQLKQLLLIIIIIINIIKASLRQTVKRIFRWMIPLIKVIIELKNGFSIRPSFICRLLALLIRRTNSEKKLRVYRIIKKIKQSVRHSIEQNLLLSVAYWAYIILIVCLNSTFIEKTTRFTFINTNPIFDSNILYGFSISMWRCLLLSRWRAWWLSCCETKKHTIILMYIYIFIGNKTRSFDLFHRNIQTLR